MAQSLLTRIKRNATSRTSNANSTLCLLHEVLEKFEGDWTNLAWIIALSDGKDKERLAAIITASSGMRFRKDTKQQTGLRLDKKTTESNVNRIGLLGDYAKSGVSFRSIALESDEGLPALLEANTNAPKARTVEEVILAAVRKARKDNPDLATDVRIIAAMQSALAAG